MLADLQQLIIGWAGPGGLCACHHWYSPNLPRYNCFESQDAVVESLLMLRWTTRIRSARLTRLAFVIVKPGRSKTKTTCEDHKICSATELS